MKTNMATREKFTTLQSEIGSDKNGRKRVFTGRQDTLTTNVIPLVKRETWYP